MWEHISKDALYVDDLRESNQRVVFDYECIQALSQHEANLGQWF